MAQTLSAVKGSITSYIKVLEAKGIHLEKAILFGSYARGTQREDSDVDLVIISEFIEHSLQACGGCPDIP